MESLEYVNKLPTNGALMEFERTANVYLAPRLVRTHCTVDLGLNGESSQLLFTSADTWAAASWHNNVV
jgi:hypothetical protein